MYLVICIPIETPTAVYFFNDYEKAESKYQSLNIHGETRIYKVRAGDVVRLYPETGRVEPIQLEREVMLPF